MDPQKEYMMFEEFVQQVILKIEGDRAESGNTKVGISMTEACVTIRDLTYDEDEPEPSDEERQKNFALIQRVFSQLFKTEKIFMNKDMTLFASHRANDEYQTYVEKVNAIYPGHELDTADFTIVPHKDAKRVKFSDYISYLKSSDDQLIENPLNWVFEGASHYLDASESVPRIGFITYPRSGNTFFRNFFEKITNVVDGQYFKNEVLASISLQLTGLKGGGIVDDRVWLVANHSPEVVPPVLDFDINRGIFIVRNPLDVIVSCLHLFTTGTHSKSLKNDFVNEDSKLWKDFVAHSIKSWANFHRHWLKTAKENKVPIYFVRFEDLANDPQSIMTQSFQYALDMKSIEGTVIKARLDKIISEHGVKTGESYKPRAPGDHLKNVKYYSEELMEVIREEAGDLIHFFGYAKQDGNSTSVFEFKDPKPEYVEQNYGFKAWNEKNLTYVLENEEKMKDFRFHLRNYQSTTIAAFPFLSYKMRLEQAD